jgi:hypothetical protein
MLQCTSQAMANLRSVEATKHVSPVKLKAIVFDAVFFSYPLKHASFEYATRRASEFEYDGLTFIDNTNLLKRFWLACFFSKAVGF